MSTVYEIYPRVSFGSAGTTYKPEWMMRFTHIVNCDSSAASTNLWARSGRQFLFLESSDDLDFPILEVHLTRLTEFIMTALSDPHAHVYIHCFMGLNRSAALAVGFVCHTTCQSAQAVIDATRQGCGRPILTNYGFVSQLVAAFP